VDQAEEREDAVEQQLLYHPELQPKELPLSRSQHDKKQQQLALEQKQEQREGLHRHHAERRELSLP